MAEADPSATCCASLAAAAASSETSADVQQHSQLEYISETMKQAWYTDVYLECLAPSHPSGLERNTMESATALTAGRKLSIMCTVTAELQLF